jgi:glycosyltransferase involved in cell wall biosynthesis
MNLHIVALPHTEVSPDFCGCAFTAKVLKFCKMMGENYRIRVYAPEGPPIPGAELVPCLTKHMREGIWGKDDHSRLPVWPTEEQSAHFIRTVIAYMKNRLGDPKDTLILLTGGWTFRAIKDAFPGYLTCEPGVGYLGICTGYCAFESYAWMNHVYAKKGIEDGRWYDSVIPNYFDPDDFPEQNNGSSHPLNPNSYLLYLGRLTKRKGVDVASHIANRLGIPLKVAGAGGRQVGKDIVAPEVTIRNAEYVGPVGIKERSALLSGAWALLVPTIYHEPFGGVAVEAAMAGTPVVATDWGAFPETVKHGKTGFRFRTLSEGCQAVIDCQRLYPSLIRQHAMNVYSLRAVKPLYDDWFARLGTLHGKGWYAEEKCDKLPGSVLQCWQ